MAKQSTRKTPDLDEILCQCFYAVGTGAGMPIKAEAIRALRNRYRDHFQALFKTAPDAWDQEGHLVLEYARTIGRSATLKSTVEGATRIDENHIIQAAQDVQKWVQQRTQRPTRFCV
jgi:hypothetical protein